MTALDFWSGLSLEAWLTNRVIPSASEESRRFARTRDVATRSLVPRDDTTLCGDAIVWSHP